MPKKKQRPKYMLVEIAWEVKDLREAAAAKNLSSAKFAQIQVKNAVERFKTKQLALISG